jgi:hypothetical protein
VQAALPVPHRILAATGLTSREITELQNLLDRATANLDGFNPRYVLPPDQSPAGLPAC